MKRRDSCKPAAGIESVLNEQLDSRGLIARAEREIGTGEPGGVAEQPVFGDAQVTPCTGLILKASLHEASKNYPMSLVLLSSFSIL